MRSTGCSLSSCGPAAARPRARTRATGMRWMLATSAGLARGRRRPGPDDDRRDHEARARDVVVEPAEHAPARAPARLPRQLAQRGLLGRLASSMRPPGSAHGPDGRAACARRVSSRAASRLQPEGRARSRRVRAPSPSSMTGTVTAATRCVPVDRRAAAASAPEAARRSAPSASHRAASARWERASSLRGRAPACRFARASSRSSCVAPARRE